MRTWRGRSTATRPSRVIILIVTTAGGRSDLGRGLALAGLRPTACRRRRCFAIDCTLYATISGRQRTKPVICTERIAQNGRHSQDFLVVSALLWTRS
jgi:hypothetical protein